VFASHGWRFNNRICASWKFMFILLGYVIVSTNWAFSPLNIEIW
jgi:hypothetical protein